MVVYVRQSKIGLKGRFFCPNVKDETKENIKGNLSRQYKLYGGMKLELNKLSGSKNLESYTF